MFSVRRASPRLLTVLAAAGLGLVGLAAPASAHTAMFDRECGSVTVHLTKFAPSPKNDPNIVDIYRNGTKIATVQFTTSSFTPEPYPEVNTGTVTYEARWTSTGADNRSGSVTERKDAPTGCKPPCQERGAFTYTFDGPAGKAVVTLSGETSLCAPVTVLLASYRTQGPTAETSGHHSVFDQTQVQISNPGSYPLQVKVPNCFNQVTLYVTGRKAVDFDFPNDTLRQFLASTVWPKAGPVSMSNGGAVSCMPEKTPPPTTPPPTTAAPAGAAVPAAAPPSKSLPTTGASPAPKIVLAVLLLGLGATLVYLGRRRRTTH